MLAACRVRRNPAINLLAAAFGDIAAALKLRRVWLALAKEDIDDQHRATLLGPVWLLISYLAFAGAFILVVNPGSDANYAPYVALGLVIWFYIMDTLSTSVALFVREEAFIKGTTLPLSVYVMRLTMQSVIRVAYAAVGCMAILVFCGIAVTPAWGWSAVAVLLILLTTPAAITVFAFLGAYFPDSQYIVSNLLRVGMFLTPVFWVHGGEGGIRGAVHDWNPFTYYLATVREPILSGIVPVQAFVIVVCTLLLLWGVALVLLGRLRRQLVFVL